MLLSNDPVSVHIYAPLALSVLAVVDLLVYSPIMQAASQTGLLMLELQIFKIFITWLCVITLINNIFKVIALHIEETLYG